MDEPSAPSPAPSDGEERLRMALAAGRVGVWDWDIRTNRVTWSDRVYEMYGLPPGSDTGGLDGFRRRVHPDDLERVMAALSAALAGGPDFDAEFRTHLLDGSRRWIATRGQLVRDADGRPLRMIGASTDVTERALLLAAEREARAQAEAARHRMELLAQAGAELSRSLDPQDTLRAIARTIVPGIADWCRIDLVDETGVPQRALAWHRDPERAARALQMAKELRPLPGAVGSMGWVMAHGEPYYGTFDLPERAVDPALRLYTQTFGMNAHYVIPLQARGRTIGAMAVIQAESGRVIGLDDRALILELGRRAALALDNARLYAEAEAARRQAEAANRSKDDFLAMLGHELRNPLAPIATALELMARRDPDAAPREREVIARQVAHLSRLIDDLLDISRITQGKVQLRREPLDLRAVAANAVEITRPLYEKRSRMLELQMPAEPLPVQGDAVRLAQVLSNLLVNAAKFTPPDRRVALTLRRAGDRVEATVEDEGAGIAADLLPRVFGLFVQGDQGIDRRGGGLGLGLAIVRSLVELHAGTVAAESAGPGRGSRFTVSLPLAHAPAMPAPAPTAAQPGWDDAQGCVLVVDDNADACQTLGELLSMAGYEVYTAGDAQEALLAIAGHQPQLALLDIGLPDTDGYELAAIIRARPEWAGLRLVALTGYGRDNDRARALEAGFDEHLVKPVSVDKLLGTAQRLLGGPGF